MYFGTTFRNRHLQRLVDLSEKYKTESEKEIQGLKDKRNFEDERGRTHVYVPNPYDSETGAGAALRSSLSAVSREGRRESRSPAKRAHASKSPRRRGTSRSKSPGLRERGPKSPGRGPKSPGRVSMARVTVTAAAASSSSSPSEAVTGSVSVPASAALISSYIDDVRGLELRAGGGGGYGGVEEHTPNVVRRARLREQQQQLQLQQRIADQLSVSTQPRIDLTANTMTASQPSLLSGTSLRTTGVDDIEHAGYSLDAYYHVHTATSTAVNPTHTPSYTHSLYDGITSPLTPDVPATPLPYPRRALYAQAPKLENTPQERDGKDKPAMSDDTVANIIQAAQLRRNQRVEQHPSPTIPVPTRTAPLKASAGGINKGNIPASLESSIADLADIMYALGAAKSSMKADRPRRRHRDMDRETGYPSNPFNMEGQGSGSVSGSDLHSVRSTSTDSPQSYT